MYLNDPNKETFPEVNIFISNLDSRLPLVERIILNYICSWFPPGRATVCAPKDLICPKTKPKGRKTDLQKSNQDENKKEVCQVTQI